MDAPKAKKLRHEGVLTAAREEGPAKPGDGYSESQQLRHEKVVTAAREEGPARPGDGYPES